MWRQLVYPCPLAWLDSGKQVSRTAGAAAALWLVLRLGGVGCALQRPFFCGVGPRPGRCPYSGLLVYTCSLLVYFPCKKYLAPMFRCAPSCRVFPPLGVPLSPSLASSKTVNDAAATEPRRFSGWRARSDVCHRPCPSIPECCALHSQAVFCTALERNKHRSDPRRAQLNSSQRQGHTVRSRPARFWPRTSTMTAREPLSTRWRKSRSPSTRSSCAKVRHRACACVQSRPAAAVGLTARHAATAAAAPQVTRATTFM